MSTVAQPGMSPARPQGPGGGNGAVAESRTYYDATGRRRTAAIPVPVDGNLTIASARFKCRRCAEPVWRPLAEAQRAAAQDATPACLVHNLRMAPAKIPDAPWFPYRGVLRALRPYLWPLLILTGLALAGLAVTAQHIPSPVPAILALLLAVAGARRWHRRETRKAEARDRIDPTDPDTQTRTRRKLAARARTIGYAVTCAGWWVALAALLGVDPATMPGRVTWTALPAVWLPYAATYWAWIRRTRARREAAPVPESEPADPTGIPTDPDEAWVMWRWGSTVAGEKGQPVPEPPAPNVIPLRKDAA